MIIHPNDDGHRALKALSDRPLTMEELRDVIDPTGLQSSFPLITSLDLNGLTCAASKFSKWVLTDMGREALIVLNSGREYTPAKSGQAFNHQGRGVSNGAPGVVG